MPFIFGLHKPRVVGFEEYVMNNRIGHKPIPVDSEVCLFIIKWAFRANPSNAKLKLARVSSSVEDFFLF